MLGVAVAVGVTGCSSGSSHKSAGHGGSGGGGKTTHASLVISPDNGNAINPAVPVVVKALHGTLKTVTVTNADGKQVQGALSADKTAWTSSEALGYGKSYQIAAAASGEDGKTVNKSGSIQTVNPRAQAYPSFIPAPSTTDVGIGQPIVVQFDQPVASANRAAVERSLIVTSTPAQPGSWYWISNKQVDYRPQSYWQAGTDIVLDAKVYGVDFGNGVYGKTERTLKLHVHDAWVAKADGASHSMQIFHNNQLATTMPISLGSPDHQTHSGIHVISAKDPSVVMDSSTYGVGPGQPGYYRETVYLDERISNDGEFVHAAPWSVGDQGSSNVSHGCINLSPANAQWFYDHFGPGDVVEVANAGPDKLPVWDMYGDWSLDWSDWMAGSAQH
jgi:lipoprotein-anchoring transpeptidase ErfK/SrfK